MEKRNQTVEALDYYWNPELITGMTIANIVDADGHIEGEWTKDSGYVQHVALIGNVWHEI